ncbi:MAG: hypothetical protein SFW35_05610 [Chitinophagales bacterium]|nr:hypothetical protein [Chitinophagales bacterium]
MRAIITTLIIVACTGFGFYAKAQDGLTFSRVISYKVTKDAPVKISVPEGKVWEIKGAGLNSTTTGASLTDDAGVLSGNIVTFSPGGIYSVPIWLPANFSGTVYAEGPRNAQTYVNIVEYTITNK